MVAYGEEWLMTSKNSRDVANKDIRPVMVDGKTMKYHQQWRKDNKQQWMLHLVDGNSNNDDCHNNETAMGSRNEVPY